MAVVSTLRSRITSPALERYTLRISEGSWEFSLRPGLGPYEIPSAIAVIGK
jgi:hypothetical protein